MQNTSLGRFKQQRGGHSSSGVQVEWEVVEWTEEDDADDEGQPALKKSKLSESGAAEDSEMRNV